MTLQNLGQSHYAESEHYALRKFFGQAMNDEGAPVLDVSETNCDLTIKSDLKGFDEDEIDVWVSPNNLVISGQREQSEGTTSQFDSFRKILRLSLGFNTDDTTASFKDGQLEVLIPKSETQGQGMKRVEIVYQDFFTSGP